MVAAAIERDRRCRRRAMKTAPCSPPTGSRLRWKWR